MTKLCSALLLLCGLTLNSAFPPFQTHIPNGASVPNPCTTDEGDVWNGVGHETVGGGSTRNPFGIAFAAANKTWTADLCAADSDNDGKTNGAELGDPQCVFEKDGDAPIGEATGHPGVCEPVTSDVCKTQNNWLSECAATDTEGDDDNTNAALSVTAAHITVLTSLVAAFM